MFKPNELLQDIIHNLPDNPGIYQYFDQSGKIIYIGKAKNLKKRVSSYFTSQASDYGKTRMLVKNIVDIKYIITLTELDALLLENNLIKKHQPKYNISLKDDKTYPWIVITNERFPKVYYTRQKKKQSGQFFGPYANVKSMRALLDLLKQLYPLRNCNYALTEQNIGANKFKVCLEYHLKNCLGPCVGLQSEESYNASIKSIKEIIKGNTSSVIRHLNDLLQEYVAGLQFEKAQLIKEKIDLLEKYQSKSTVVNPALGNLDVFSFSEDINSAYINYVRIISGAIIQSHTLELKKKLDESREELLLLGIIELRQLFDSNSKEILIPFPLDVDLENIKITVPERGDKMHLIELSLRNLEYFKQEKHRQQSLVDPEANTNRIMEQMKKDLRLSEQPRHIECFDNSNFHGEYAVSAMTVFKNGKASKKDYRHFNVKTVVGPDDFATMEEVIYRRYKRVLEEHESLPQLIVIDGGKGQLSAAIKSLEKLGLMGKVGVIGIAKKLEEIYYPGDTIPMYIDKKSESLKIIQQIRDEAHRFGITHHRKKRSKGTIKTELDAIKGISAATSDKLLSHFKSVKKIKEASLESLSTIVGKSKAQLVFDYFQPKIQSN